MKKSIVIIIFVAIMTAHSISAIRLIEYPTYYSVVNDNQYIANIPKSGQSANGMIRALYIFNGTGYSKNVVYSNNQNYGLGYIEGTSVAWEENGYKGNSHSVSAISVKNSSKEIVIRSTGNFRNMSYILEWTFLENLPYFKSYMYANETTPGGRLTNQYQFCNMLDTSPQKWYTSRPDGTISEILDDNFLQYNQGHKDIFPLFNSQLSLRGVSLGWLTYSMKNPGQIDMNTGDWKFELQYSFYGANGATDSIWAEAGMERELTLIYYVSKNLSSNEIYSFSKKLWEDTNMETVQIRNFVHGGAYNKDMYWQPAGPNAELYNPFIRISNNLLSVDYFEKYQFPSTWIRVYQPYFSTLGNYVSSYIPLMESRTGDIDLSYSKDSKELKPRSIDKISKSYVDKGIQLTFDYNLDMLFKVQMNFTVWNDSDKMLIKGTAQKATEGNRLDFVYHLDVGSKYYEAQDIASTETKQNLEGSDSRWSWFNHSSYQNSRNRNALVYHGYYETVPKISYKAPDIPPGEYMVWGYLKCYKQDYYYNFSFDDKNWFTVNGNSGVSQGQSAKCTHEKVYLGTNRNVSGGLFLYQDDDNIKGPTSMDSDWMLVDGFSLSRLEKINDLCYAIRWFDNFYKEMEQIVCSDKPISFLDVQPTNVFGKYNSSSWKRPSLRISLFSSETQVQSQNFQAILWNRIGWSNDISGITDLHTIHHLAPSFEVPAHNDDCEVPYEGIRITKNTRLCPGDYLLPDGGADGAIQIRDSDVTLDCNNAVLQGDISPGSKGIFIIGASNVTIKNCHVKGYQTGIYSLNSRAVSVRNVDFSDIGDNNMYMEGSRNDNFISEHTINC